MNIEQTYDSIPTDLERQGEIRTSSNTMDALLNELTSRHSLASMGVPLLYWTPEDDIALREEMILACKENWDEWLEDPVLARDMCRATAYRIATDDRLPPPPPRLMHTVNTSGNFGMFVNPNTCSCETCHSFCQPTPTPETLSGPSSGEPFTSLRADACEEQELCKCLYCGEEDSGLPSLDNLCADCFWDVDSIEKRPGRLASRGAPREDIERALNIRDAARQKILLTKLNRI